MQTADWQHAVRNSTDGWTATSVSSLAMRLKPNFGKNSGAVSVRRKIRCDGDSTLHEFIREQRESVVGTARSKRGVASARRPCDLTRKGRPNILQRQDMRRYVQAGEHRASDPGTQVPDDARGEALECESDPSEPPLRPGKEPVGIRAAPEETSDADPGLHAAAGFLGDTFAQC